MQRAGGKHPHRAGDLWDESQIRHESVGLVHCPALPTTALASESPLRPSWSLYLSPQRLLPIQEAVLNSYDWTLSSPTPMSAQPEERFAACPTRVCQGRMKEDLCYSLSPFVTLLRVTYPQPHCTGKSAV